MDSKIDYPNSVLQGQAILSVTLRIVIIIVLPLYA